MQNLELSFRVLLPLIDKSDSSDLHLVVGRPPMLRRYGKLSPIPGYPLLTNESLGQLLSSIITDRQAETLKKELELDFAYALPGFARFRVNYALERGNYRAVLRRIPEEIPSIQEVGLPPVVNKLTDLQRGLVLVTGPTGSGKSTSLAAMIRRINENRYEHILTVEDPVEFVHPHLNCIVTQREVGKDTLTFGRALKAALRQDPDVILVGEMRDLETIETAITAAETGHLVFATLHTQSAPTTIDRIIDVFPASQQQQIRTQLAVTLKAVITQTLVPRIDKEGRIAAHEVLIVNDATANLIREAKVEQLRGVMQTNAELGMQTMDDALAKLVISGTIDIEEARLRAQDVRELNRRLTSQASKQSNSQGKDSPGSSGIKMG